LLHVLEYGEFQRIGGVATIKVDVRIIAATNKELLQEVEAVLVGLPLKEAILKFKKQFIARTLRSTNNNQIRAAEILQIQRTYLNRLVKELELVN